MDTEQEVRISQSREMKEFSKEKFKSKLKHILEPDPQPMNSLLEPRPLPQHRG